MKRVFFLTNVISESQLHLSNNIGSYLRLDQWGRINVRVYFQLICWTMVPKDSPSPFQMFSIPDGRFREEWHRPPPFSPVQGLHNQLCVCAEGKMKENTPTSSTSSWGCTIGSSGGKGRFMKVAEFASDPVFPPLSKAQRQLGDM